MKNDKFDMYGMDEVEYYHAMEKARYLEELIAPNISDVPASVEPPHAKGETAATNK